MPSCYSGQVCLSKPKSAAFPACAGLNLTQGIITVALLNYCKGKKLGILQYVLSMNLAYFTRTSHYSCTSLSSYCHTWHPFSNTHLADLMLSHQEQSDMEVHHITQETCSRFIASGLHVQSLLEVEPAWFLQRWRWATLIIWPQCPVSHPPTHQLSHAAILRAGALDPALLAKG